MKGFIEVTLKEKDVTILINIQYIQMVVKNCIEMQYYKPSLVYTKETYEEIKELIKKAME